MNPTHIQLNQITMHIINNNNKKIQTHINIISTLKNKKYIIQLIINNIQITQITTQSNINTKPINQFQYTKKPTPKKSSTNNKNKKLFTLNFNKLQNINKNPHFHINKNKHIINPKKKITLNHVHITT